MYYVYLLRLSNDTFYAGFSSNLKQRILEHSNGYVQQTAHFRPVILVWYAAFHNKILALRFEKYLKTGSGYLFRNKHLV